MTLEATDIKIFEIQEVGDLIRSPKGHTSIECQTDQGIVAFWATKTINSLRSLQKREAPFRVRCGCREPLPNYPTHSWWVPDGTPLEFIDERPAVASQLANVRTPASIGVGASSAPSTSSAAVATPPVPSSGPMPGSRPGTIAIPVVPAPPSAPPPVAMPPSSAFRTLARDEPRQEPAAPQPPAPAPYPPREVLREVPREKPREVPRETPREVQHEAPPREAPRDVPREAPRDVPREAPRETPRDTRTAPAEAPRQEHVLYVVSASKSTIWDDEPQGGNLSFVPALFAYRGKAVREWLSSEQRAEAAHWLFLSPRYGLIEPDHPIARHEESFSEPESGAITDDALRVQVTSQRRWDDQIPLREFQTVYLWCDSNACEERTRAAFERAGVKVVRLKALKKAD